MEDLQALHFQQQLEEQEQEQEQEEKWLMYNNKQSTKELHYTPMLYNKSYLI